MPDCYLVAGAARAAEAVAAVDGLVTTRHERDAGHATARVANGLVHLARATVRIATTATATAGVGVAAATAKATTRLTGGAALGATAGGIGQSAGGVKLLLAGRPAEGVATITARAWLIGIGHRRHNPLHLHCVHG